MNFKEKLENRLKGSKFRLINEKLYKNKKKLSDESIELYHKGFKFQTQKWPSNPIDMIITHLKNQENLTIADLGCGDARLSESLINNKIISYDLYPMKDHVIKCDITDLPAENDSFDIVIFCLSLMNKNIFKHIKEANRVCKNGGKMIIAEVVSRVDNLKKFISEIESVGFKYKTTVNNNKYFFIVEFEKCQEYICDKKRIIPMKICDYKRR